MSSNGKVAIVTGGGTGIGKHSALALLREGYSVAIAGRRPGPLEETVAEAARRRVHPGRPDGRRKPRVGPRAVRQD